MKIVLKGCEIEIKEIEEPIRDYRAEEDIQTPIDVTAIQLTLDRYLSEKSVGLYHGNKIIALVKYGDFNNAISEYIKHSDIYKGEQFFAKIGGGILYAGS